MWHIKTAHSFYPDMTKVKVAESRKQRAAQTCQQKHLLVVWLDIVSKKKKFKETVFLYFQTLSILVGKWTLKNEMEKL